MIKVLYILSVGSKQFEKTIEVLRVPIDGTLITAATYSFVVEHSKQNLDAYDAKQYETGLSCETVTARFNEGHHGRNKFLPTMQALTAHNWQQTK